MTRKEYFKQDYKRIRALGKNMFMSWYYAKWNTRYKYPE